MIIHGDCIEVLKEYPPETFDLVFADPPYNLNFDGVSRPKGGNHHVVTEDWDNFESAEQYEQFTQNWLTQVRRVMKKKSSLWVTGTYHNIFIVGYYLLKLKFEILNDIIWIKDNPPPNFSGSRFAAAHETLIWCRKKKGIHTFNYAELKEANGNKQIRSDWYIAGPSLVQKEKIMDNGKRLNSTQKPSSLLYRVIMASSKEGDLVLDPFCGSGTTGRVCKRLNREFVGIEKDLHQVEIATQRIELTMIPIFY